MAAKSRPVRKSVIPVAGLGTRFLPATKAIPKEMLPVVDKPAIQYVVEESVRCGLPDILMITGRNKGSLEDHFDVHWELEQALEHKNDHHRLSLVRESSQMAAVHFVRQGEPRGLGHAVLCAKAHVGDEPFAVLLGDDLIDERDSLLDRMTQVRAERGGSVVALMEVPREQVHLYGCAEVEPTDDPDVVRVRSLVEKPDPGTEPSTLIVIGRYVLDPSIFPTLEATRPGRNGEIQLTDALQERASATDEGAGVHGVIFRGRRYDTGDRLDYLKSVVRIAMHHKALGDDFRTWLEGFVADGMES